MPCGNLPVVQAGDGLDNIRQRMRQTGFAFMAAIFATRRIVIVQGNVESQVDRSDRTTDDDGPARRIGLDDGQTVGPGERHDLLQLPWVRAVIAGEAGMRGCRAAGAAPR
jgi:hypothetical protein